MTNPQPAAAEKTPFSIEIALERVRDAVRPYPKAAMFELAERGFATPFQQLVACVVSIRTRDEESLPLSLRLFERAPTPAAVAALSPAEINALIRPCTFHERKADQIYAIARRVLDEFGGALPCDEAVMRSFAGVGVKCANLALGVACTQRGGAAGAVGNEKDGPGADEATEGRLIAVDVHVHRVTNRWGYVSAPTPEKTMVALQAVLPPRYDVEINALLVPFGKHICTGVRPRCSTCPVLAMCRRVGVSSHR